MEADLFDPAQASSCMHARWFRTLVEKRTHPHHLDLNTALPGARGAGCIVDHPHNCTVCILNTFTACMQRMAR